MAQWLRALADLAEDQGSIPRTSLYHLQLLFQSIQHPFLAFICIRNAHGTHLYMQTKHPNA